MIDKCFDGHHLTNLCQKLSRLRSLSFALQLQFFERPSNKILNDFIEVFRQSYWINGPLDCIRMCINYHQVLRVVQICSLPYRFSKNIIHCTIDLIETKFNVNINNDENRIIRKNMSMPFELLWHGMRWLCVYFVEKQKIPIAFFEAIQCLHARGKLI